MSKLPFLKVRGTELVNESGRPVRLKGVALGGWLMMEGYMLYGRNMAEKAFKESFDKALGKDALDDFTRSFRDTFIREEDIKIIKGWGANCVRIPFNYRLIEYENRPFSLNEEGLSYLDRAVSWCEKNELYCILDMHAAPGAQNPDWHSDCHGRPELFTDPFNQERYLRLWHFIAGRYKDSSAVAGYDVLNEPIIGLVHEGQVRDLYQRVTKEIRDVDAKHILFFEGTEWAQRIAFLGKPWDKNSVYSIHVYLPTDFTFNFVPGLEYPVKSYGITWNKSAFDILAKQYRRIMDRHEVPLYVGEFGVQYRDGLYGELNWVKDMLYIIDKYNMSWTYWTYKTVANNIFPDGIYRYVDNPLWVHRQGPLSGWETYHTLWQKERHGMISSWKTDNFKLNTKLCSILKERF